MKSIKKNFLYNLMYQILLILTPLVTIPYVSRVLGPDNIGRFAYTFSIVSYFVLISMLGVKNYGNRSIAIVKGNAKLRTQIFFEIFTIQFIMSVFMLCLYFGYVLLFDNSRILYIQSLYLFAAMFDISWFYFGMEEFKFTAIRSSLIKVMSVIMIFLFVKDESDLLIYSFILSTSTLLSQVPLWISLRKFIDFKKIETLDLKSHIKPNLVLFIPVLAVSMYTILDKIMLGAMSSMEATAFFESTEKIVNVPFGVIMALGSVMLPRTAYMIENGDEQKSKKYLDLSMYFILIISIAMAFGISGVSFVFAPLFFGKQYEPVGLLICFISPIIIFKAWANVIRTQFLIPRSRDKDYVLSVFIGAIINVISNIILIPILSALGAVISTVLAEAGVAIYQTFKVKNELPIKKYLLEALPFFGLGFIMFFIIFCLQSLLSNNLYTLLFLILVGIIIYLIGTILIFWYRKDLNTLKKLIGGNKI